MDAVPGKWTDPTYETFIRCMHLTGSGIICLDGAVLNRSD